MENIIQLHDKQFKTSIFAKEINDKVSVIAKQINNDLKGKKPVFLVILNGAFVFAADLLKMINIECEVSFVKLSSYSGTTSTSTVRELIGLDASMADRTVVVVEDIIDTGLTMGHIIDTLRKLKAKDVKIATLLYKPESFKGSYKIDYIGKEISNDFIVGYGLDYDGLGRNLPEIYKIVGTTMNLKEN